MSDPLNNPAGPTGAYVERGMDIAVWTEEFEEQEGEWQLSGHLIDSLAEGRDRLAAKRRAHPNKPAKHFRLVHAVITTALTDMGE